MSKSLTLNMVLFRYLWLTGFIRAVFTGWFPIERSDGADAGVLSHSITPVDEFLMGQFPLSTAGFLLLLVEGFLQDEGLFEVRNRS